MIHSPIYTFLHTHTNTFITGSTGQSGRLVPEANKTKQKNIGITISSYIQLPILSRYNLITVQQEKRPVYQTQPEVYGKVKWMVTSKRLNLFIIIFRSSALCINK